MSQARVAAVAFAVVVVAAVPLYLWRGRQQWFYLDEWDFLAARSATSLHDLLRPHNEHWSTLPILAYRALWNIVGLHSYKPYQLLTIGLHLTAACLLRVVMRRADVGPWIATIAASLFVLFGPGHQNVIWAFQVGFVGSLVCGLADLILADHDGPLDRRDVFGLVFGIAGLMSSGVGVTMVFVVGLAVLIRRGWRAAAFHLVPLAALFVAWWLTFGRDAYTSSRGSPTEVGKFVAIGVERTFADLGQLPGMGMVLGVLLVGGLVLRWHGMPRELFRKRYATIIALFAGGFFFLGVTGVGRVGKAIAGGFAGIVLGPDGASAGRYVHLLAAMFLPAIAVAADTVIRRWRVVTPAVAVVLLIGIPGNVDAIAQTGRERFGLGQPDLVLALPRSPFARQVPRSFRPLELGPEVTMGWLLDGYGSGRLPDPHVTASQQATVSLRYALQQSRTTSSPGSCLQLDAPVSRRLPRGASLRFAAADVQIELQEGGTLSEPIVFDPARGEGLQAIAGPLDLRIGPTGRGDPPTLCG